MLLKAMYHEHYWPSQWKKKGPKCSVLVHLSILLKASCITKAFEATHSSQNKAQMA